MVRIFDYYDYRAYLETYYRVRKESEKSFSYRYIQQQVGIDPGFLRKVFHGDRELSPKFVEPFIELLKLKRKEAQYFRAMVNYGRSKDKDIKEGYLKTMLQYHSVHCDKIEKDQFEYFQKWYYAVIREILTWYNFKDDYKSLASVVYPSISLKQVKDAIAILKRLEFISPNSKGYYKPTSRFITTGNEWISSSVREFQKQTLSLAMEAIDKLPKEERDISTVTLTISQEGFRKVKAHIAECTNKILETVQQDTGVNQTFNLNFSIFPVSEKGEM